MRFLVQNGCFLSFEREQMKLHELWPPWNYLYGHL